MSIQPGSDLWNTLVALQDDSPERFDKVIQTAKKLEELNRVSPDGFTMVSDLVQHLAAR